jgi:hypothetical protein
MTIRSGDACQSRPLLVGSQLLILRPLQQLGDIDGDAPRLVARQQICGGSTTQLVLGSVKLRLINMRQLQLRMAISQSRT